MDARTFIQTAEVWLRDERGFRYAAGLHGPHSAYAEVTRCTHLEVGAGLQGAVATCKRAKLWSPLGIKFARASEARAAGLHAALGVPVLVNGECQAVVVLMCGHKEQTGGGIELWEQTFPRGLSNVAGYYGKLSSLEAASRHLQCGERDGLPGQTLQSGRPVLLTQLETSELFMRRAQARRTGLHAALSIPVHRDDGSVQITVLMSSAHTPLAHGMEIWSPRGSSELVLSHASYAPSSSDLGRGGVRSVARGEGAVGRAFDLAQPVILTTAEEPRLAAQGRSMNPAREGILAIPVLRNDRVTDVVSLIL